MGWISRFLAVGSPPRKEGYQQDGVFDYDVSIFKKIKRTNLTGLMYSKETD
jgi:hypothetical protein